MDSQLGYRTVPARRLTQLFAMPRLTLLWTEWRCLTRSNRLRRTHQTPARQARGKGAKSLHSALASQESHAANHSVKGGTLNRPCAHVSRRKQRAGHMQGRNVPSHACPPEMYAHFHRATAARSHLVRALSLWFAAGSAELPSALGRDYDESRPAGSSRPGASMGDIA